MSNYREMETVITEEAFLVQALKEMGFTAECHKSPQHLFGYHGDQREDVAHVIIRRAQVGTASNDIGFRRGPDGKYRAIISDYDQSVYGKPWMGRLMQNYTKHRSLAVAAQKGYVLQGQQVMADGSISLTFGVK